MRVPEKDDEFRFLGEPVTGDDGTVTREPIGNDEGRVLPGLVVRFREFVDAGTPGAGNDEDDCYVVEWDHPSIGWDDDGQPIVVHTPRAWSVNVADWDRLFEKVSN